MDCLPATFTSCDIRYKGVAFPFSATQERHAVKTQNKRKEYKVQLILNL